MKLAAALSCVWLLTVSAARADEDCGKRVGVLRSEANKLLGRDAKQALAKLNEAKASCATLGGAAKLWLLSDLAFAAHKAGDAEACAAAIGEADDDALVANPKVTKALLHNAELCAPKEGGCDYKLESDAPVCKCKLALELSERNAYDGYEAKACGIAGYEKAAVVIGAEAEHACIGMTPTKYKKSKRGDDEGVDESAITCPRFFVVEQQGGKAVKKPLAAGSGWWTSPSDCCGATKLLTKGQSVILTSGGVSRDCFGGTAATDLFTVMKRVGGKLVVERDLPIGWH